jgi:hypothetical protein
VQIPLQGSNPTEDVACHSSAGQVTELEAEIRLLRARVLQLEAAAADAAHKEAAAHKASPGQSFLASLFNK